MPGETLEKNGDPHVPVTEGLDPTLQTIGTFLFMAAVAVFSAYHHVTGKKPAKPQATEFAVAGQLADMGPVKELVENVGLLVQQQVRTNMALEATAKEMAHIATIFEARLEEERRDREIAEEVRRQLQGK